jgi:hypothetical protein
MSEIKNCLLVKYCGYFDNDEEIDRCYALNQKHTAKFKICPVKKFDTTYPTANGYDTDYIELKQYFIAEITEQTYNILNELNLVIDADEIIEILNKNDDDDDDDEEDD